MPFGAYRDSIDDNDLEIKIGNTKLNRVDSCKYLSSMIGCYFRWNVHSSNLNNKMKYLIYVFYKLKKVLLRKVLEMLYYALFENLIRYGVVAYGGAYQNALGKLDRFKIN